MPTITRLCTTPGCGRLAAAGSTYCAGHKAKSKARARLRKAEADRRRPSARRRGYDRTWQAKRKTHLQKHPHCVDCGAKANHVDHVVPLSKGGRDDESNYASRCHPCHSRKTINEFREDDGRIGGRP